MRRRRHRPPFRLRCRGGTLAPLLALLLVSGCASSIVDPEASPVVVPVGDPELGRQVFMAFDCGACHRVVGDPDLQMVRREPAGPDLGLEVARRSPGALITAIIAPSHEALVDALADDAGVSPMPSFNERLTVAQLLDLIAFLRSEPTTPGLR